LESESSPLSHHHGGGDGGGHFLFFSIGRPAPGGPFRRRQAGGIQSQ